MVHTTLRTRNHIAAGDYIVYGWITDDRKHMLRIMKLNEDYTKLTKDVIAEIDCPPQGPLGKLMVTLVTCKMLTVIYGSLSSCTTTCGYLGSNLGCCS